MSHLTQAQFNAAKIHCEEVIKNVLSRIEAFDFRQDVKNKIFKDFGLDRAQQEMANIANSRSYAAMESFKAIAAKANSFFSAVQTYVAYNFDLNITDYKKAIKETAELLLTSSNEIINAALASTEDELLKTYIRSAAALEKYQTSGDLLKAADEKMKGSRTYQKRALQNAKTILAEKKADIDINSGLDAAEIIRKTNQETINDAVDKAVRDRVLSAIIKIIKEQGFIVKKENVEECGDHAKISAIKPNGEQANFVVHMDGKFIYKFHNYEGLSCEKDIGNFEDKFESIYGVKLEEKKIKWSNPDMLGKMAHQVIETKKIGG